MAAKVEGRQVNQAEHADIFGVSVVALRAWERRGCPVTTKGRMGLAAQFDTADVARWREQQAAAAAEGTTRP
jgi:phage terminase Nu1 subunit (DNA packaging protein)